MLSSLKASRCTLGRLAATEGSTDENDISLAKTGATKCVENESNDVMNATVMNDGPAGEKLVLLTD